MLTPAAICFQARGKIYPHRVVGAPVISERSCPSSK